MYPIESPIHQKKKKCYVRLRTLKCIDIKKMGKSLGFREKKSQGTQMVETRHQNRLLIVIARKASPRSPFHIVLLFYWDFTFPVYMAPPTAIHLSN